MISIQSKQPTPYYDAAKVLEQTQTILNESWVTSQPDEQQQAEDALPRSKWNETISQGQGSRRLRQAVVAATQAGGTQVLSPQALRACSASNKSLHQLFTLKRVGHALTLKGNIPLPNGETLPLECFHETYTRAMLDASLETLAHQPNQPEMQERASDIKQVLADAIYCDQCDDAMLETAVEMIKNGTQKIPLLIASGWDWHSTQVIFYNGFVAYHNRGLESNTAGSGWHLYKIGSTEKIDLQWLKKLTQRILLPRSKHLSQQQLVKDLEAKLILLHPMQGQKVGNCTYTSLKAAISCMLFLWESNPHFENELTEEMLLKAAQSNHWKSLYKLFTAFDRQLVARDFLIDLEDAVQSNSPDPAWTCLAHLLYQKLCKNPLLGEKIGWTLWLKIVEYCQQLHTPKTFIPESWIKLAKEFSAIEMELQLPNEHSKARLIELGKLFASPEHPKYRLGDILKELTIRGHFDEACSLIENNVDKEQFIARLGSKMVNRHALKEAEACALKLSSHSITDKIELLKGIYRVLIKKGEFQEAQRICQHLPSDAQMNAMEESCLALIKSVNLMKAKKLVLMMEESPLYCYLLKKLAEALAIEGDYLEAAEIDALIPADKW
jgi:hypothetical protein